MQVAILAGGLGTRLREAVKDLPKSMAPIDSRPFLECQLAYLKGKGFTEILLLVGYLADVIVDHFGDGSSLGLKISYSREEDQLGTGGALKNAEELLDSSFLVLNGDTFFDVDYNELIRFHREKDALITIALVSVADSSRYGAVGLDEDGRILAFAEKAGDGPGLVNGGVYVVDKRVLAHIQKDRRVSLEKEVIPRLLGEGERVFGLVMPGCFIDIGTPESYDFAKRYFAGGLNVHKE
ncbi:MAG: nucleotidyltransferase family protein [Actinobacteria bacterium]|nr:nucleotidyltransferase family protein [Actinomycetota bacterium]